MQGDKTNVTPLLHLFQVIAVNSVVALLVLIAACLFVSGIVSLDNSSLVQTKQLNIGVLEAASVSV